jgi:lipopolysaccharide transport system ATP-binding protein
MGDLAFEVSNVSKMYHLGTIGYGSLKEDFQSFVARFKGKPDPNSKLDAQEGKHASEFWALHDVSFQLEQGDRLGIIGRNGAGKSTLLKIMSRITTPSAGEIRIRGKVSSLLEVGTGFVGELTGRDNVFLNGAILGMKRREIQRKFDEIVAFSGVEKFIDTPVKRFSSGMYVRLAFSVAAHLDTDVMILDEVLAVGDASFQGKCLEKMKKLSHDEGRTIVFVSHAMSQVEALCNQILYLKKGVGTAVSRDVSGVAKDYLQSDTLD